MPEQRPPIEITVSLDLDKHLFRHDGMDRDGEPLIGPTTLEDVVIGEVVATLTDRMVASNGGRFHLGVIERFQEIRDEELRARVIPLIEQAISSSLQPTDTWGNPKGPAVTMTEVITNTVKEHLTKDVSGSYGRSPRTLVHKFIADEVDRVVAKELKAALDASKAQVAAAVQQQGAAIIAKTITEMAKRS